MDTPNEAFELAAQKIRYYLKFQDHPNWEEMTDYQRGVEVTCNNLEKIINKLRTEEGYNYD